MGWNSLSIPKLQRCNRWRLGISFKKFHPTLFCYVITYQCRDKSQTMIAKRSPTYNLLNRSYQMIIICVVHSHWHTEWRRSCCFLEPLLIHTKYIDNIKCLLWDTHWRPAWSFVVPILIHAKNIGCLQWLLWFCWNYLLPHRLSRTKVANNIACNIKVN